MKRILVAVDGSGPSLGGVRMAANIAQAVGARLDAVYVSPPNLLPPQVYADVIAKIEAEEKRYAGDVLRRAAEEATKAGVVCEQVNVVGAPAEAIADLAEDPAVWLIVVGSRGHGALSRVLLGSVADRLVHISKKPVLVAR